MSQVQNSRLHNYIQPIALMAVAYIAGSKRFIRYFPGASQGGLCLATGLGVATTLASPHIKTPAFLQTDIEKESAMHSFMRVASSLALGTIAAPIVTKFLKGRVSFCVHAAGRLMGLEGLFTCVFVGLSSIQDNIPVPKTKKEHFQTIEEKHANFLQNIDSWNALSKKQRSHLAQEFYHADLPVLPLGEGELDTAYFEPTPDFLMLSRNQLEWYTALYLHCLDLNVEQSFALNAARQRKQLPSKWKELGKAHCQYGIDTGQVELFIEWYQKNPRALAQIGKELLHKLQKVWVDDSVCKVLFLNQSVYALSGQEISTLCEEDIIFMWYYLGLLEAREKCSAEQQVGLNTAFSRHGMRTYWIWPLTEAHLTAIQTIDGALKWAHEELVKVPIAFGAVADNVRIPLILLFRFNGMKPIEDADRLLTQVSGQEILSLDSDYAQDWKQFFEAYPEKLKEQNSDHQVLFHAIFRALDDNLKWWSNELILKLVEKPYVDYFQTPRSLCKRSTKRRLRTG